MCDSDPRQASATVLRCVSVHDSGIAAVIRVNLNQFGVERMQQEGVPLLRPLRLRQRSQQRQFHQSYS